MDPELVHILQFVFVVGLVIFAIARSFLRIFVKPFVPGSAPGSPDKPRNSMMEFLDELRRDLGHEQRPATKADGLLDGADGESEASPATPPRRPGVDRRFEKPPVPAVLPGQPPPSPRERPRPAVRSPTPVEVVTAAQRMERALAVRAGRVRPAALDPTREQVETEQLARDAREAPSLEEPPHAQVLGTDIETAFILKEVLGPPRAYRRLQRRA